MLQYMLISFFERGPVTSINKCNVLTAHAHENQTINTRLSLRKMQAF